MTMHLSKFNRVLLAINLVMLATFAYCFYARPWVPPDSDRSFDEETPVAQASESLPAEQSPPPQPIIVTNQLTWAQLESEDYRSYIQRLRSIGCPEQTIRDIIIADLDKLIAPRLQSIYGRRQDLRYWHPEEEELANDRNHSEWRQKERALDREKRQIIQELLGLDLVRERMKQKGEEDYYERRLRFLPEEKRDQVRQILDKYDDQEQSVRQKEWDGESLSQEELANLQKMRKQRESEISQLLSPAEREQYELWISPTANAVRRSIYGMEATEEEFQSIYQLRKKFDEQYASANPAVMDDATLQKYTQAAQEMENQIRQALGDKRYEDYKRGSDEEFHYLNKVVSQYNLPRSTAIKVYEFKQTAADMRKAVQEDPNLTPEQRQLALRGVAEETDRTLKQLLGEKAFYYYQRRDLGQ